MPSPKQGGECVNELRKPIVWPEIGRSISSGATARIALDGDLRRERQEDWIRLAQAYERNPEDFHVAWWWLQKHPIFWCFASTGRSEEYLCWERGVDAGLEFRPVKVNPDSGEIDEDPSRNTRLEIWVEVFPTDLRGDDLAPRLHDYACDTGGATYEEAVVAVAREIYRRHGNDRVALEEVWRSS